MERPDRRRLRARRRGARGGGSRGAGRPGAGAPASLARSPRRRLAGRRPPARSVHLHPALRRDRHDDRRSPSDQRSGAEPPARQGAHSVEGRTPRGMVGAVAQRRGGARRARLGQRPPPASRGRRRSSPAAASACSRSILPGHGGSGGRADLLGGNAQPAIRAALAWLARRPGVDPARIAGLGMSLAGETLLEAAARGPRLAAVISDGAERGHVHKISAGGGSDPGVAPTPRGRSAPFPASVAVRGPARPRSAPAAAPPAPRAHRPRRGPCGA